MDNKVGTIYIATNLLTGKQYVGQTVRTLRERIVGHKSQAKRTNTCFAHAIQKYGIGNLKWISFSCPEGDLDWTEQLLIKELNTLSPSGYNLDGGGQAHKYFSAEHKAKISKNHADVSGNKNGNFARKHTEKEREKMRGPRPSIQAGNHPKAKPVVLISPKKEEYLLSCYGPFCRENNLNTACIHNVLHGKQANHKGWTGRYLEGENNKNE